MSIDLEFICHWALEGGGGWSKGSIEVGKLKNIYQT
jgi:hypothetical protein